MHEEYRDVLVVDRIRRSFGPVVAVDDVSFRVERGSVFGLLGPNGAGKTTIMRMLLGIFAPDKGSIAWEGRPIDLPVRRRFGYLPEERGLYGKMKVRDQIVYFGRLHGLALADARKRAKAWMETLDIERYANRACNELSKGNQQKVQLASAVLHDPALLVLDEPFSGLDPMNAEKMLASIAMLAQRGTTLVLSSHQMFVIEHACRAFCIIGAGRVRAAGTLEELRATFPTRSLRLTPDLPQFRALLRARGYGEAARDGDGALLYELPATADFGALLRAAVESGPLESFERRDPSLSAIYVRALDGSDKSP